MTRLLTSTVLICIVLVFVSTSSQESSTCQLKLLNRKDAEFQLNDMLKNNAVKQERYNVTFRNYSDDILTEEDLFRPYHWVRTLGRRGMNLLMLDENYEILSLGLLHMDTEDIDIELIDEPVGCMRDLSVTERINNVRNLVYLSFRESNDSEVSADVNVCNMRMDVSREEGAKFKYVCCQRDPDTLKMVCADIETDEWVSALLKFFLFLTVALICYLPNFVPDGSDEIMVKVALHDEDAINIHREQRTNSILINRCAKPLQSEIQNGLNNHLPESESVSFTCKPEDVTISVNHANVFSEDSIPVSITSFMYDFMFNCQRVNIVKCCYSSVWKKCSKLAIVALGGVLFLVPSIVQIILYNTFKKQGDMEKVNALNRVNASSIMFSSIFLKGFFFTKEYISIISACFVLLLLALLTWYTTRFNDIPSVIKQLQNIKKQRHVPVLKTSVELFLYPFNTFGERNRLCSLIYFILSWILSIFNLIIFIIISIPLFNVGINLILKPFLPHMVAQRRFLLKEYFDITEEYKKLGDPSTRHRSSTDSLRKRMLKWYTYTVLSHGFFFFLIDYIFNIVSFYATFVSYTIIGIIIHSTEILPFLTGIILFAFYTERIFANVRKEYKDYLNKVRKIIVQQKESEIKEKSSHLDNRTSFVLANTNWSSSQISYDDLRTVLYYKANILFFIEDIVENVESYENVSFHPKCRILIARKLFYDCLDIPGGPGPIWVNMKWALFRWFSVIVFLIIVVMVVMSLGDIPFPLQMFFTLAGGFIPFVFTHFFKGSQPGTANSDSSDLNLNVDRVIRSFTDTWRIVDMTTSFVSETAQSTELHSITVQVQHSHSSGTRYGTL